MTITPSVSEIILAYLIRRYPDRAEKWQRLADSAATLVPYFQKEKTPEFTIFTEGPPERSWGLLRCIQRLELKGYLEYDSPSNTIKVTNLGAVLATSFSLPKELMAIIEQETSSTSP